MNHSRSITGGLLSSGIVVVVLATSSTWQACAEIAIEAEKVPSVVGMSAKDAKSKLDALELTVEIQLGVAAPTEDKEFEVYAQEPSANSDIPEDGRVAITIYGNAEKSGARSIVRGIVPSVEGLTAADAKSAIEAVGLTPEFHLGKPAPSNDKSLTAYSQEPKPGTKLANGGRVQITIYRRNVQTGPTPVVSGQVPNLIGLTATDAQTAIRQAGFVGVFRVGPVANHKQEELTVCEQKPAAGTRLDENAIVEATIRDVFVGPATGTVSELTSVTSIPFLNQATDHVEPRSGQLLKEVIDLVVPAGATNLEMRRTYCPKGKPSGMLGTRWRLNWEKRVLYSSTLAIVQEGAEGTLFTKNSSDEQFLSGLGDVLEFSEKGAVCTRRDGTKETYDAKGRIVSIDDVNGSQILLRYDTEDQLVRVDGPFNTFLRFVSDTSGRLKRVHSSSGAVVSYAYGSQQTDDDLRETGLTVEYGYDNGNLVQIDHPQSGRTTLTFDSKGRVTSRRWADEAVERFEYDDAKNIVRHIDPTGRETRAQFGIDNIATRITNPAGFTTSIENDAAGRPVSIRGPTHQIARFRYDSLGRIEAVQSSSKGETRFEYEDTGHKPSAEFAPDGTSANFEYDEKGHLLRVTDDENRPTGNIEYFANGLVKGVVSQDGRATKYDYDIRGNLASITDVDGQTSKLETDACGNPIRLIDSRGNTTHWEYDIHNRPTKIIEPDGSYLRFEYTPSGLLARQIDHKGRTLQFEYDNRGRLIRETGPDGYDLRYEYWPDGKIKSVEDDRGNTSTFEYNQLGLLSKQKKPTGREISYRYDRLGRLIRLASDAEGVQALRYNRKGDLTSISNSAGLTFRIRRDETTNAFEVIDSVNRARTYRHDGSGKLTEATEPNGDQARYERDDRGRVVAVHQPGGGVVRYEYDQWNNLVRVVLPNGKTKTFQFDEFQRLVAKTDAKGQTTKYEYDRLNRLIVKRLANGKVVRFEYDGDGNLVRIEDAEFPIHYAYDQEGYRTRIEYPAIKRSLSYAYDGFGRIAKFVDGEGTQVLYKYDSLDRPTEINVDGKTISVKYDVSNRPIEIAYPNGVIGRWRYNSSSQVEEISYANSSGTNFAGWSYAFDDAGNLAKVKETVSGIQTQYTYDASGQLLSESSTDGFLAKYRYAKGGNRLSRETASSKVDYDYDQSDQLVRAGNEELTYDANGNLAQRRGPLGTTSFSYDAEDQLVQVSLPDGQKIQFGYGPTGVRIWRKENGETTWFVSDGENLLSELGDDFSPRSSYFHAFSVDTPLMVKTSSRHCYIHADHLGSVKHATDQNGQLIWSTDTDAFGQVRKEDGEAPCPFGFTGREATTVPDLYYFRARYYDASLGRFLSRDPLPGNLSEPISLNAYAYALNSPTRFVDPFGMDPEFNRRIVTTMEETPGLFDDFRRMTREMVEMGVDQPTAVNAFMDRMYDMRRHIPIGEGKFQRNAAEAIASTINKMREVAGAAASRAGAAAPSLAGVRRMGRGLNTVARGTARRAGRKIPFVAIAAYGATAVSYARTPEEDRPNFVARETGSEIGGWAGLAGLPALVALLSPDPLSKTALVGWGMAGLLGGSIAGDVIGGEMVPPGSQTASGDEGEATLSEDDHIARAEALTSLIIQMEAERLDRELTEREIAAVRDRIRNAQADWERQQIYDDDHGMQDYWDNWADEWAEDFGDSFGAGFGPDVPFFF
ncbi:MAG: PASTA domain-containing protein [Planctomycetales bacterium]|nr:PASTA domain-containing protein [Planctomycetales bacterium]